MERIPNKMQTFSLTLLETAEAYKFNDLQRALFHNMYVEAVEARLRLTVDPDNLMRFIQEEAYQVAKMELLDSLLNPTQLEPHDNKES